MDFSKERSEALCAGRAALASLEKARNMLSSARSWGVYDTFFRGGLISGLIKHSKMRSAQKCITDARNALLAFNREMGDLNLMGINLDTRDLLGFVDVFSTASFRTC